MGRPSAPAVLLCLLLAGLPAGAQPARPPLSAEVKKALAEALSPDAGAREAALAVLDRVPPLKKKEVERWRGEIEKALAARLLAEARTLNGGEMKNFGSAGVFTAAAGGARIRYYYRGGGDLGKAGYPLYLNLHGGGDSEEVNDGAFERAKEQYDVAGARIVPRATQDVALSWAVPEIWPLVDRLLMECFLLRDVDPDRVYLMGYSMGGWGTLLMAPAMADRFAAAAASAGGEHAPRAHPENLRNTPLRIQIGTEDHPFQRYALSKAYGEALRALRDAEPAAYVHEYREHAGKGHAIVDSDNPKWLSGFVRRPWPEKVVWRPVGPACGHVRTFYYLALAAPAENMTLVVARDGNTFTVEKAEGVEEFSLLLSDDFADLDEPVVVRRGDRVLAEGKVERRLRTLFESLAARGDRRQAYPARLSVRP